MLLQKWHDQTEKTSVMWPNFSQLYMQLYKSTWVAANASLHNTMFLRSIWPIIFAIFFYNKAQLSLSYWTYLFDCKEI